MLRPHLPSALADLTLSLKPPSGLQTRTQNNFNWLFLQGQLVAAQHDGFQLVFAAPVLSLKSNPVILS